MDSLALEEPSFQAVHSQRLKDGAAVLFDWECILGQARTFWRHAVHNQRDVEETFVLVAQNVVMLGLGDFILVPFNREHEFATALVGFEAQIQAEREFSFRPQLLSPAKMFQSLRSLAPGGARSHTRPWRQNATTSP